MNVCVVDSFIIVDLESEDSFVVTVNISICFEANAACEVTRTILDEVKMKKPTCDWSAGFLIPSKFKGQG